MTTTLTRSDALDYALLQSRIIETGLERLAATISQADAKLRDELASYRQSFNDYVSRVRDARALNDS